MRFLLTEIIMFLYKNNFCRGTFLWLISMFFLGTLGRMPYTHISYKKKIKYVEKQGFDIVVVCNYLVYYCVYIDNETVRQT